MATSTQLDTFTLASALGSHHIPTSWTLTPAATSPGCSATPASAATKCHTKQQCTGQHGRSWCHVQTSSAMICTKTWELLLTWLSKTALQWNSAMPESNGGGL